MQQGSSMSETRTSQRFHSLNAEQVEVLDQVLSEVVPIHGRGNFPTLELRPRDIITAVRARLETQGIKVRDVRLNGSTASHVLVRDNGTSYKDLDIIFGVELPRQEDFQVIKESVLGCLLDCLPAGVNKERISSGTMKEAYVQKMVKVFNEHDRWSLISLSNNSGKNLELKFVSTLRRQFEFSVDSFQIILDRLLESYLQQEAKQVDSSQNLKEQNENIDSIPLPEPPRASKTAGLDSHGKDLPGAESTQINQKEQTDQIEIHEKEPPTELSQATEYSSQSKHSKHEDDNKTENLEEQSELMEHTQHSEEIEVTDQTSQSCLEKTEPPNDGEEFNQREELSDHTECLMHTECSEQAEKELLETLEHSNPECEPTEPIIEQKEHPEPAEHSDPEQTEPPNLAEPSHNIEQSGKLDFSECPSKNQCNNEGDDTQPLCSSDDSAATNAETDARSHTVDVKTLKVDAEKQLQAEEEEKSETESEENSTTDSTAVENSSTTDDCCTTSTLAFTFPTYPKQKEAPDSTDKEYSESTYDTMDPVNPPDTQDMLPAPSSLVSDTKNPSLPANKASNRLSQMVVLKHSSPKPPRRMCRKAPPNPNTNPVCETETVITPSLDPNPIPKPETTSDPDVSTASSPSMELNATPTKDFNPEINSDLALSLPFTSNVFANPEPTSTTDSAPDQSTASDSEPVSALAQEPTVSQPGTDDQTTEIKQKETLPEQLTCDKQSQIESSPHTTQENTPPSEQSNPPDLLEPLPEAFGGFPHTEDPVHHSEAELSEEDESEELQIQMVDLDQPSSSTSSSAGPPSFHSCLTPPMLSLSPPCLTPPSPSLSPPPCLSPPPRCLASPMLSISPPPSLSSPPLSFSPTSSCLSSPPYLTPPMLSLSPPPHCLTPPLPCLSPPLLCLTPPVESEGVLPQVSSELEALVPSTECEGQSTRGDLQPVVPLPQPQDKEKQNSVAPLPLVPQPASLPLTAQSPSSEHAEPAALAPPTASEVPTTVPEVRTPEESADTAGQSKPRAAVPAVEVLAESMYGDFEAAMDHLRYRLIATRNPEQIRGGGLLKYSNLLVRDYRPASETQIKTLERYMCSRFFIDFPDVQEQQRKILSYLKNHFIGEERSKYQYLMTLRRVVDDSTVCLMGHERRQTLNMITVLALKVLGEQNIIPNTDHVTCFYQPAPYLAEHSAPYMAEPSYCSYYIPQGGSTLLYQPYPLHLHSQTGLV